jgi:hypothetical protein
MKSFLSTWGSWGVESGSSQSAKMEISFHE